MQVFVERVVSIAGDEIALWQDNLKGASVTDPGIYKSVSLTEYER